MLRILEVDARALVVKSDSEYVVDGCVKLHGHIEWDALDNGDLWQRVYQNLATRGEDFMDDVQKAEGLQSLTLRRAWGV